MGLWPTHKLREDRWGGRLARHSVRTGETPVPPILHNFSRQILWLINGGRCPPYGPPHQGRQWHRPLAGESGAPYRSAHHGKRDVGWALPTISFSDTGFQPVIVSPAKM